MRFFHQVLIRIIDSGNIVHHTGNVIVFKLSLVHKSTIQIVFSLSHVPKLIFEHSYNGIKTGNDRFILHLFRFRNQLLQHSDLMFPRKMFDIPGHVITFHQRNLFIFHQIHNRIILCGIILCIGRYNVAK